MGHNEYNEYEEEYKRPQRLKKASSSNFGARFSSENKYEDVPHGELDEDYSDYGELNEPREPTPPKKNKFNLIRDRKKDKKKEEKEDKSFKVPPMKTIYAIALFLFGVGVIGAIWNISLQWALMNWGGRLYGVTSIGTQILFTALFYFLYKSTPSANDLKMASTEQLEDIFKTQEEYDEQGDSYDRR